MTIETLLSKDGRAILDVCRRRDITITFDQAEALAGRLRAFLRKKEDGELSFSSHPNQSIERSTDQADDDSHKQNARHQPNYWRFFLDALKR
jgi:hypothetical protein